MFSTIEISRVRKSKLLGICSQESTSVVCSDARGEGRLLVKLPRTFCINCWTLCLVVQPKLGFVPTLETSEYDLFKNEVQEVFEASQHLGLNLLRKSSYLYGSNDRKVTEIILMNSDWDSSDWTHQNVIYQPTVSFTFSSYYSTAEKNFNLWLWSSCFCSTRVIKTLFILIDMGVHVDGECSSISEKKCETSRRAN